MQNCKCMYAKRVEIWWLRMGPTHCWCVISLCWHPRSWYDRLTPEVHSMLTGHWSTGLRFGELGGQRAGGIKSLVSWSSSATVFGAMWWGTVLLKNCLHMLHECQEAASVSNWHHDSTYHWFWPQVWADACTTQYEFIVVNSQTTTSAFHIGDRFERRNVDKKSKPTRKLKHKNSILEYFEYLCQISSKSILIILSCTVSKLTRFFETLCT